MKNTLAISFFLLSALSLSSQIIDGGNQHTIVLAKDGIVWTMGSNEYGELGDSTFEKRIYPAKVKGLPKINFISRGYKHSMAVDENKHVWTWGWNNYGQLGAELPIDYNYPQQVDGIQDVIAVEGGHWHSLVLKENGEVWSWGDNPYGQLGTGDFEDRLLPIQVKGLPKIKKIACGSWHTLALDESGKVWTWGRNENGMLGNGKEENSPVPIIVGLEEIEDIGGGCFQSVATDKNGCIWVWGENWNGQLGIGNYNRIHAPVKSLITLDEGIVMSKNQIHNFHPEARLALFGLPNPGKSTLKTPNPECYTQTAIMPSEKEGASAVNAQSVVVHEQAQASFKSRGSLFVEHNEKFLLSFIINLLLVGYIIKRRRNSKHVSTNTQMAIATNPGRDN